MLNAEIIKQKAKELGAAVCGIGKLDIFSSGILSLEKRQLMKAGSSL